MAECWAHISTRHTGEMVQVTGQIEVLTSEGAPTGPTAAALVPPASSWLLPVPALSSCPIATPLILWLLLSSPCLVKHPHRHDGNSEFSLDLNPGFSGLPMKLITAKAAVIEAGRALCMSGSSGNPDAQLWGLKKGSGVVVGVLPPSPGT